MIECPACGYGHLFWTEREPGLPKWSFDGNLEQPTFSPSMLVNASKTDPVGHPRCHSFVKNGKIQFLDDCSHSMKGQTVDLTEFEYEETDNAI